MIFWGDERCVPPTNDESNYKMTSDSLIKKINIPASNIYRIEAEKDPAEEAERYSNQVRILLPHRMGTPRFDLVMLGIGEDGHTASIFPGEILLFNSEKLFEVSRHPLTGQKRITATGKLINNSKEVCFLVTGESKAERVAQIIEKKPGWERLPASLVLPENGELVWMLDGPAAQMLNSYHASHRRF
jgi:6-phosphogluconolactonase